MRWFYHIVLLSAFLVPQTGGAAPGGEAGWDRVAWGMSSNQIAGAYGDRAVVLTEPITFGDSYADVVLRDVPFAGYPFRVYFQMDMETRRLAHVLLERRRQYANPKIWNAVVARLRAELGEPTLTCRQPANRGKPMVIDGIWKRPDETVYASYLDFAAGLLEDGRDGDLGPDQLFAVPFSQNLYPARRIVIRYSPGGKNGTACAAR